MYWLVAVVLGYAATLAFYCWRRLRVGVAGRALPYALTGVALPTETPGDRRGV